MDKFTRAMQDFQVYPVLAGCDLDALKAVTPDGFDWSSAKCTTRHVTPLHYVVYGVADDEDKFKDWLEVADWLLEQGADPRAVAGDFTGDEEVEAFETWKGNSEEEKQRTKVSLSAYGFSALAFAVTLREHMGSCDAPEEWLPERNHLKKLIKMFSTPPRNSTVRTSVNTAVVDRWEAILRDTVTSDVVLDSRGGAVWAHSNVLINASPVLKALLSSAMIEGQHKRINVSDTPMDAVRFFLELMYTGGTKRDDVDAAIALSAIELAHRWAITDVVDMIERCLKSLLSDETFVEIACVAQMLQLGNLSQVCVSFAAGSRSIQSKLSQGSSLPTPVLKLLGRPESSISHSRKKRRMF